ncbi:MAG: radical SAM protein, partial [Actinomycetota bacterium]
MRVLLVSTYELGHQPLHVASPAAALRRAGHDVRCLDLTVEMWDEGLAAWADKVAFSVPMHTATRIALEAADQVPTGTDVAFYGLYAGMARARSTSEATATFAGEYEPALVDWAGGGEGVAVGLGRQRFDLPARDLLPPLDRYARLVVPGGEERLVGYAEASHGCVHRCRHCPIPVVYDGRIRVVGDEVVLDDITQLVGLGARHITFGDPDFLNGPHHSIKVVRAMHERFPDLTFDCTVKVEHILRHRDLWGELAAAGCLFVVSAVEHVDDAILERLDKGHTAADAVEAVSILRGHGIELRPSLLPFTPWTTRRALADLIDFVAAHDLVGNVDPVQYSIRLLLPDGSLLLDHPDMAAHLGP